MPSPGLDLPLLTYCILTTALRGGCYHQLHLREEIGAQRSSHSSTSIRLGNGRAEIWTQVIWPQSLCS